MITTELGEWISGAVALLVFLVTVTKTRAIATRCRHFTNGLYAWAEIAPQLAQGLLESDVWAGDVLNLPTAN